MPSNRQQPLLIQPSPSLVYRDADEGFKSAIKKYGLTQYPDLLHDDSKMRTEEDGDGLKISVGGEMRTLTCDVRVCDEQIPSTIKKLSQPKHGVAFNPEGYSPSAQAPTKITGDNPILHPIEAIFLTSVIKTMHKWALIAGEMEAYGLFGGKLCVDANGRAFTVIEVAVSNKDLIGEATRVEVDELAAQTAKNEIASKGLIPCGFWHSHPTYTPFLSDRRTMNMGADVKTTHHQCSDWWQISAVIDPYPKKDYNSKSRECLLSVFKMADLRNTGIMNDGISYPAARSIGFGWVDNVEYHNDRT